MMKLLVFAVVLVLSGVNAGGSWECAMKTKLDKSPYECCNFKKFVKDEDMKACGTEFGPKAGGPPPMPPPGEQPAGCCISQCILKKVGIFNNDAIDKSAALKYIETVSNDPKWTDAAKNAVDTCMNYVKKEEEDHKGEPLKADFNGNTCSPMSGQFIVCFNKELFMNCPEMDASPACIATKASVKECPVLMITTDPARKM